MRRVATILTLVIATMVASGGAALACGFLVAENGAVRLDTFTAASVLTEDGDAHYVTSFSFNGSPESFGAVIPLPDVPTEVEKAPGWFLQRLLRETAPVELFAAAGEASDAARTAEVLATYEVDALDITVLKGGGASVLEWAADNGFDLGVADGDPQDLSDATAMLDFYAERSPVFAAIRFDNERASKQQLSEGEGIPVRFSFTGQDEAWIPVKILTFDKPASEIVVADLFLLTPDAPNILGGRVPGTAVTFQDDYTDDDELVVDLVGDERADWIPTEFTLTRIDVRSEGRLLDWDVAARVDALPDPVQAFGVSYASGGTSDEDITRGEVVTGRPWLPWAAVVAPVVLMTAGAMLLRRRRGA